MSQNIPWHDDSSASPPSLNTCEILDYVNADPSLLQSPGNESDVARVCLFSSQLKASSSHSHTGRKIAAAAAAGGGIALGAKAIHSYRNRSRSSSSSSSHSCSRPRPSSPEVDQAARARNIGRKVAIGAGVATLALGAGVAGTAAYIHHKRKERRRNGEKGPFMAKLVGKKYGKLDPSDPFGIIRHHHPNTGSANTQQQQEPYDGSNTSPRHYWGSAAFSGATATAVAGGLLYKHSRSHSDPPRPPPYHRIQAPDPFSASPSPQFIDRMNHTSPSDPFGYSSGYSQFSSYMGETPDSIVSRIRIPTGRGGGGVYITSNPFGAQNYGNGCGGGGMGYGNGYTSKEEHDLSHRVHTSLSLCDDTDGPPVREARDLYYGPSFSPCPTATNTMTSSSSSSSSFAPPAMTSSFPTVSLGGGGGTSVPSIFGDDGDCGCGGDLKEGKYQCNVIGGGDMDIFNLVNRPVTSGSRYGGDIDIDIDIDMAGVPGHCGWDGRDTFVGGMNEAGYPSRQGVAY